MDRITRPTPTRDLSLSRRRSAALLSCTLLCAALLSACSSGSPHREALEGDGPLGKWPLSVPQSPFGEVELAASNRPLFDPQTLATDRGTSVRGRYGWEGRIVGLPAPHSGFARLVVGMRPHEVIELLGPPTDRGFYLSDRAYASYYFGSDPSRWEMVYPGQGRLVFATQQVFGTGLYLTQIIHAAPAGPPH